MALKIWPDKPPAQHFLRAMTSDLGNYEINIVFERGNLGYHVLFISVLDGKVHFARNIDPHAAAEVGITLRPDGSIDREE